MANFKERIANAFPVFSEMMKRDTPLIRSGGAPGAVAGDFAIDGISPGDDLFLVMNGTTGDVLTSEFDITGPNRISNPGGTPTTGGQLLVQWIDWT